MDKMIHPSNIEHELERIWDSLEGTNKMRACLFNLIFYTKKDKRTAYLDTIAKKVIERFPSRIIFITIDDEKSEDLTASVSIMSAEEGECSIVCDLINIDASGSAGAKVPFVILPHLLPDLPIYLVYADDPSQEDPISQKLEKLTTRIIFDSETAQNVASFAKAALDHKKRSKCDIADLNWGRIESWRDLLASSFKSSDKRNLLSDTRTLHIHYNGDESETYCHTNVQAIYLQGWLATRLGWKLESVNSERKGISLSYEKDGKPLQVYLHPTTFSSLPSGRITSIEIETANEENYSFTRSLINPNHISIELSTPKICSIPTHVIFDRDESGASLVREICHKGTSEHYLDLLKYLKEFKCN